MDYSLSFKVNENIYLRDPEGTELGKQIIKHAIELIHEIGFEHFTFKKLAIEMNTTEASIYRYFTNKHRLLLYILNWYWSYMEYLVVVQLEPIQDLRAKLERVVELFTHELPERLGQSDYNKNRLHQIVISESSKVYLVKEVKEINENEVFKPYKDLCARISELIKAYQPNYPYPHSLSTTLIETAHSQLFFSTHLPKLTDVQDLPKPSFVEQYLKDLVFKALA
ncbi:TetR/AcrR family transcriptional regulator [Aquirufa sp. LEPPI-3A]|uniref:TetR/AcrR family transcriptional regulator n=1 Tax=Aquirufa regiilacus TaxID=3024868 RepID=UPI0028DD5A11|nr:TetR/AcrR family transcriptional regulator [Aquirufa sp. LEPPI-3A]MDT8886154.1 TetR/AcrR family transcriptional regulator [Aquirufa sp. LEPPI-3A]